jgi:serine O-acetyltransferase
MPRPAIRTSARRVWHHVVAVPGTPARARFWSEIRAAHPPFLHAVAADARITAVRRGERATYRGRLDKAAQVARLMLVTESFFGQVCYRGKAALQARRVPLLPRLLHHLSVSHGQIVVGDPVVIEAGVFIPHGQVCIDGFTRIGRGSTISPFTSIGLRAGDFEGPTIGEYVEVGTGARLLGPWIVGDRARIGANAVIVGDVPADRVAVGVPARILEPSTDR